MGLSGCVGCLRFGYKKFIFQSLSRATPGVSRGRTTSKNQFGKNSQDFSFKFLLFVLSHTREPARRGKIQEVLSSRRRFLLTLLLFSKKEDAIFIND
jgi:hypothetical protein